ncbi:MAG TPA: peptide chain release factor N(5)-glutamine methyltransferase [Pseudogracilibacillus sp.]|nr:peptide chain release factor N(5)-glutamine methyltransferase [Pseudogracilibacillus sp.]
MSGSHPMKQHEVLHWASSFLEKHGREASSAAVLLQHHLQIAPAEFYLKMQEYIAEEVRQAFMKDVKRHAETGIPVQHILGLAPFFGRDFVVNEDVLIPRFDTEVLIEQVMRCLEREADLSNFTLVDIGTGSGIIAITLKLAFPMMTVYATDISERALTVAKQNADLYKADIQWLQGDFLEPFMNQQLEANVIVSNPPYIDPNDRGTLQDTVKDYDPELALYAENHGLQAYQKIMEQTVRLNQQALRYLFFEIGYNQGEEVSSIIRTTYPASSVSVIQDLGGQDRVVAVNV